MCGEFEYNEDELNTMFDLKHPKYEWAGKTIENRGHIPDMMPHITIWTDLLYNSMEYYWGKLIIQLNYKFS